MSRKTNMTYAQKFYYILALALIVAMPFGNLALAATWGYEQNFDGLSLTDLTGQDSWTLGQGTAVVSNEQALSGAQSVKITGAAGNPYRIRTVPDANTNGTIMYVAMRTSSIASNDNPGVVYMWGNNGATRIGDLYINVPAAGDWSFRKESGGYTDLGNVSANTWYCFGVDFDFTNNRVRLNIDGGAFSSYITTDSDINEIDTIWIGVSSGAGAYNYYFDSFTATAGCGYVEPSAAPVPNDMLIVGIVAPPRPLFIV